MRYGRKQRGVTLRNMSAAQRRELRHRLPENSVELWAPGQILVSGDSKYRVLENGSWEKVGHA